ncbi:MAG: hypothetical protein KKD18_03135 [Nanoarchaeota archaeon]|nr:hypothetical protein [Nanoarchaeota archaeon]
MLKNGADEKNKLLDPILKVWGGAKSEGVWTAGKGESLSEEVIVQPRHSFYYSGLYLGDRFHSPLIRLIGEVIVTAHQLKTETSLSRLEYWEAFRNPGRDYTRPPR